MTDATAKITTVVVSALVILAMLGISWWHIDTSREQILESNALVAARSYADTFVSLRAYYTREVVSRVPGDRVAVTHDYKDIMNAIPLPATLTIELAEEVGKLSEGFSAQLYSNHPWPWRAASRQLDGFAQRALETLTADPDQPFYEIDQSGEERYLRYAAADTMKPACVACHNSHPQSPKKDWAVGDLVGVLEISMPLRMPLADMVNTFDYLIISFIIGGIILITLVIWVVGRR
ncbi:MAG: DUF3365 domain-containing protein [Thiohalobacterales bacterium]|nr:DUF3365 domain-containing protein [Thiohalobacterales bacterium]